MAFVEPLSVFEKKKGYFGPNHIIITSLISRENHTGC